MAAMMAVMMLVVMLALELGAPAGRPGSQRLALVPWCMSALADVCPGVVLLGAILPGTGTGPGNRAAVIHMTATHTHTHARLNMAHGSGNSTNLAAHGGARAMVTERGPWGVFVQGGGKIKHIGFGVGDGCDGCDGRDGVLAMRRREEETHERMMMLVMMGE